MEGGMRESHQRNQGRRSCSARLDEDAGSSAGWPLVEDMKLAAFLWFNENNVDFHFIEV
jgi:hypothetical protein